MRAYFFGALRWGWLIAGLCGALSAGCNDEEDARPAAPLTDFERGNLAELRFSACGAEPWSHLSTDESLGILVNVFPELYSKGADCVVAATSCEEVLACRKYFLGDQNIEKFPECGSQRTDHCEGNVAKYCLTDDDRTWYEASYDCELAGATCIEGVIEHLDIPFSNCVLPEDLCDGQLVSYCHGSVAVLCQMNYDGFVGAGVFDCADAFGATCVEVGNRVECEGPGLLEVQCDDGKDNDADGQTDCDDIDCDSTECRGE